MKTDSAAARQQQPGGWLPLLLATAALLVGGGVTHAAPLDQPIQATFKQLPLRTLVARLQAATGVPLILDRRLDPTQRVSLDCRGEPLAAAVGRLAETVDAELAVLESSAWLVPAGEAGRITAAARLQQQTLRRLPLGVRRRLEAKAAWSWPAGATPAELLEELVAAATASGLPLTLTGLAQTIPHDHLAANSLPPLSLVDRFGLISMQYGRRIDWQGTGRGQARLQGTLVPLPEASAARPAPVAARAPPRQPAASSRQPADPATSRYTLRVAAPFAELLAAVAKQLGLAAQIDRPALRRRGIDPREIIRLEVADVDRDGLLDAIVAPLNLTWAIEDDMLTVTVAPLPGVTP